MISKVNQMADRVIFEVGRAFSVMLVISAIVMIVDYFMGGTIL